MAILNGIEGSSHVVANLKENVWSGYLIFDPDLSNIRFFDILGPASTGIYEGPLLMDDKYYFGNGKVQVTKVNYSPAELRVEFIGVDTFQAHQLLSTIPDDFLP